MTHKADIELAWGLLWMVGSNNPKVVLVKDILLSIIGDSMEDKERAIQRALKHGHKVDTLKAPPQYKQCRNGVCDV